MIIADIPMSKKSDYFDIRIKQRRRNAIFSSFELSYVEEMGLFRHR